MLFNYMDSTNCCARIIYCGTISQNPTEISDFKNFNN